MRIYLAGPITGCTYSAADEWRTRFIAEHYYWSCASPMRGKELFAPINLAEPLPSTFDDESAAVARDLWDIRRADVVLINLHGSERVSIGTMCELGYAHAQGKLIVVARGDDLLHDHLFVQTLASKIVDTLDDAVNYLKEL